MFTCSSRCQATQESFHYVETSLNLSSVTRKQLIMLPQPGSLVLSAKYLLLLRNSHLRSRCLPRSQPNHQLNRPVMWAPRLSSYKRETTLKQPSSEQDWVTNRNSSSSTSLGPTEMYSRGNQRICQGCPRS